MKKSIVFFLVFTILLTAGSAWSETRSNRKSTVPPIVQESIAALDKASSIRIPFMEGKDFTGTGLFFDHTCWISIPRQTQIDGNPKLSFSVSHSRTLAAGSTLTVTFNDEPIKSFELAKLNPERSLVELEIPKELIQAQNTLSLRFYAVSSVGDPCQDLYNPANWALVHRDAYFEFRYIQYPIRQIADFESVYLNNDRFFTSPLTVVLPKDPTSKEIEAAVFLIQYLGNKEPNAYSKIQVAIGREEADRIGKGAGNLLSLGAIGRNSYTAELQSGLPVSDLEKLKKTDGILLTVPSPYNPTKNLFLVSGASESVLYKTVEILTYPQFLSTMKKNYSIVQTDKPLPKIKRVQDKTMVTFRELGYYTTKLAGIFEVSTSYNFRVPVYWRLLPGASLSVLTSYSPILNPDKSLLTVNINDRPIKSFKLSGGTEDRLFDVPIPEDLLKESNFYITISSSLDIGVRDCVKRHDDKAWVLIQDATHFHFPHRMAKQVTFRNYPALFAEDFRDIPIRLVLPDQPTESSVRTLLDLIYAVSSALSQDAWPQFQILKASEASIPILSEGNVVLIGLPMENPWIRKVNSYLPVEIDTESGCPLQTSVNLLSQFLQNVATLELTPSPWNPKRSLMVMTADQGSVLAQAGEALLDPGSMINWQGNVVFVNSAGESYSNEGFLVRPTKGQAAPFFLLSILAVAGIAVVFMLLIYRRNKKARKHPSAE